MSGLRVLVMEDDALIGALLAEMLAEMGHDVCAIEATEADAVSAAARHKPDIMIVDARLRGGSGMSAVDAILQIGYVPHFYVSGDTASVRARKPRAVVVEKPFREAALADAISRALAGPRI